MNYQDAVSLFRARYDRLAVKDSKLPKLTNTEILVELSVIQSDLQNKYMLSTKSSRDNSTPQTTLTAGTAVYLPGTSAGTIPNDILQIYNVSINDTLNSTLEPIGISFMRDYIKATGRPRRYVLRNQGQIFDAVMEFDTLPDQAYTKSCKSRHLHHRRHPPMKRIEQHKRRCDKRGEYSVFNGAIIFHDECEKVAQQAY